MKLSPQCSVGSLVRIVDSEEILSECALFTVNSIESNGYYLIALDDKKPSEPFFVLEDELILIAN